MFRSRLKRLQPLHPSAGQPAIKKDFVAPRSMNVPAAGASPATEKQPKTLLTSVSAVPPKSNQIDSEEKPTQYCYRYFLLFVFSNSVMYYKAGPKKKKTYLDGILFIDKKMFSLFVQIVSIFRLVGFIRKTSSEIAGNVRPQRLCCRLHNRSGHVGGRNILPTPHRQLHIRSRISPEFTAARVETFPHPNSQHPQTIHSPQQIRRFHPALRSQNIRSLFLFSLHSHFRPVCTPKLPTLS